jgi:hypothetical protein
MAETDIDWHTHTRMDTYTHTRTHAKSGMGCLGVGATAASMLLVVSWRGPGDDDEETRDRGVENAEDKLARCILRLRSTGSEPNLFIPAATTTTTTIATYPVLSVLSTRPMPESLAISETTPSHLQSI